MMIDAAFSINNENWLDAHVIISVSRVAKSNREMMPYRYSHDNAAAYNEIIMTAHS